VVDGISGYTLHVELIDKGLIEGGQFKIPSENCRAYLHTLNAPSFSNITDIKGIVKVIMVEPDGAKLEFDVKSSNSSWAYAGVEFFKYAKHSCVGKVDWACEFYSK
jgi:hypothetical protein